MRCSCCVLLHATKLGGEAGKRTSSGSWSPRTPRTPWMGGVSGARTPHEFLRKIVRMDSSKGHLIINKKTGPGWKSHSRMGVFFPKINTSSTYITCPEFIHLRWISACLSCCSFSYQVSLFNYVYPWVVDTIPCTWCNACFSSILWILLVVRLLRYSSSMVSKIIAASNGNISSTDGPNTASAGKMMSSMQSCLLYTSPSPRD